MSKSKAAQDRARVRDEAFPGSSHRIWPDHNGKGWAKVPRTLPVILRVLDDKSIRRGDGALTRTYLTLLSQNWDEGLIKVENEEEFARLSGFSGARAVRSWRERMQMLVELGFIEAKARYAPFGFVLIVHPLNAMRDLHIAGKISESDWLLFTEKHHACGATEPPREPFQVVDGGLPDSETEPPDATADVIEALFSLGSKKKKKAP